MSLPCRRAYWLDSDRFKLTCVRDFVVTFISAPTYCTFPRPHTVSRLFLEMSRDDYFVHHVPQTQGVRAIGVRRLPQMSHLNRMQPRLSRSPPHHSPPHRTITLPHPSHASSSSSSHPASSSAGPKSTCRPACHPNQRRALRPPRVSRPPPRSIR